MDVTLKDIAREAGFSVTTVSRALAGYDDVNEKTRQHIIQIAQRLGYQPNLVARHLRSQRTHTIGLVIPEDSFSDGFFSQLMMGIGQTASTHKYDLLLSAQVPGDEEIDAYRRIAGGNRVDGMVIGRTRQDDPRLEYLEQIGHPFVVSGRLSPVEVSNFPYIDVDGHHGLCLAVDHLAQMGHTHIALILPPKQMAYTAYRFAGYCEGLSEAGLSYRDEYVVTGDLKQRGGYEMTNRLLDRAPQVTAIVASNDLMALGAMQAAEDRGLVVGRDVAVTGFDDIPAAEHAVPPLTTVRQPIFEIGQRLAEMLIQLIENHPPEQLQVLLRPTLIIRASSDFHV